jgi:hypothetical protein
MFLRGVWTGRNRRTISAAEAKAKIPIAAEINAKDKERSFFIE